MEQPSLPRISIVTPSYNQAEFLERTILSVLNSGYPNLEYIIIDGGSTDDSLSIIKKYQERVDYWVSERDNGQSHAINKGLAQSSGVYFGWLNSDDYLEPGVLRKVAEAFADSGVGTVCGKLNVVDAAGNYIETRESPLVSFESLLNGAAQIIQPGSFHRKELLDKYGGVREGLRYAMDYELWLRLGQYSEYKTLGSVLANYTLQPKSKTCMEYRKFLPEISQIRRQYGGRLFSTKSVNIARCHLGYWRRDIAGWIQGMLPIPNTNK